MENSFFLISHLKMLIWQEMVSFHRTLGQSQKELFDIIRILDESYIRRSLPLSYYSVKYEDDMRR